MDNYGRKDHQESSLNTARRIRDLEHQIELLRHNIAQLSDQKIAHPETITQFARIPHADSDEDFIGFASHHPAPNAAQILPIQASHPSPDARASRVRERIRQRRLREKLFGTDLFADPAWDMMLDLYAAQLEGNEVSVSSLCIAAAVPTTTALRWIKLLSQRGWLLRSHDPGDGRRVNMHLSETAKEKLDRYFDNFRD